MKPVVKFTTLVTQPVVGETCVLGGVKEHHTLSKDCLDMYGGVVTTSTVIAKGWHTEDGSMLIETLNTRYVQEKRG